MSDDFPFGTSCNIALLGRQLVMSQTQQAQTWRPDLGDALRAPVTGLQNRHPQV